MTLPEAKPNSSPAAGVSRSQRFVNHVIDRIQRDTGFAARLRRADNPATEYQSWELLADFGVDLEKEWERMPYCTIGAAVAKAKPASDGAMGLGAAIAACYDDGNQSDQARARLRRLLACSSTVEVCLILRPLLTLINSRGVKLNFKQLLEQIVWYSRGGQERIRSRWAQDFYHRPAQSTTEGTGDE